MKSPSQQTNYIKPFRQNEWTPCMQECPEDVSFRASSSPTIVCNTLQLLHWEKRAVSGNCFTSLFCLRSPSRVLWVPICLQHIATERDGLNKTSSRTGQILPFDFDEYKRLLKLILTKRITLGGVHLLL